MKSLFKKRTQPFVYNKFYISAQHLWVQKMNGLTQKLSRRKLIYLLVLFTVLIGSFFIYRIYKAFSTLSILALTE